MTKRNLFIMFILVASFMIASLALATARPAPVENPVPALTVQEQRTEAEARRVAERNRAERERQRLEDARVERSGEAPRAVAQIDDERRPSVLLRKCAEHP